MGSSHVDIANEILQVLRVHKDVMASSNKEVATEILPVLRVFKDGTVDRLVNFPYAPPSPQDPTTGVSSKDVAVSPDFSARLYLPPNTDAKKLPILVYFHGGGFCFESGFSLLHHAFICTLVAEANALVVSVEYRLAPEHPLPAAYEDSWAAIQWVASHSLPNTTTEGDPWLLNHGDFHRLYIGGDSSGGNIVHHMALRASTEGLIQKLKISGGFLCHPYFWGSEPIGEEASKIGNREDTLAYKCWMVAHPCGGIDDPMINPFADDAPSLAGLGCSRLLVCVAEKDELRDRGVEYYKAVKESGWKGEVELVEDKGENHYFHMIYPHSDNAKAMLKRLASFING